MDLTRKARYGRRRRGHALDVGGAGPLALLLTACTMLGVPAARAGRPLQVRDGLHVEDLGTPARAAYVAQPSVFTHRATGQRHLCAFVMAMNRLDSYPDPPLQVYDLNLVTGEAHLAPGVHGRSTPDRAIAHSNGKLYVGTGRPCNLMEYDPATRQSRLLAKLSDRYYQEATLLIEGPDAAVYVAMRAGISASLGAEMARYDPATGHLRRIGKVGGEGHIYGLAADGRHIYCALGPRPWHLVVYDLQAGKEASFLRPGKGDKNVRGRMVRSVDGACYYLRGKEEGYALRDGKPRPLAAQPTVKAKRRGGLYSVIEAPDELGLVIDVSRMLPTNWNRGALTVRWRPTRGKTWRSSTLHAPCLRDNSVRLLAALPDGKLLGCTSHYVPYLPADPVTGRTGGYPLTAYGPFFLLDPRTRQSTLLGLSPGKVLDVLVHGGKAYLAGPRSLLAVYDPARPWTHVFSYKRANGGVNPRVDLLKPGPDVNSFMVSAADGRVYVAQRGRGGGALLWLDPKSRESGAWREPFKNRLVYDVVTVNDGRLVVAATARLRPGLPGRLVVYEAGTGRKAGEFDPFQDEGGTGKLMPAGTDHVIGVIRRRTSRPGQPPSFYSHIYRLNLRTGKLVVDKRHPGKAFAGMCAEDLKTFESRLAMGPDGCGWLFVDKTLCRIHPEDARVEKVMVCDFAGRMIFVGKDLYLYNGGRLFYDVFAGIKRIRNVFRPVGPEHLDPGAGRGDTGASATVVRGVAQD